MRLLIQHLPVARRAHRLGRGRRPNPAVILDQRQIGAKILVENRHASDDSAWQNMLPAPLWGLDSIWTMNPESPVHGLSERLPAAGVRVEARLDGREEIAIDDGLVPARMRPPLVDDQAAIDSVAQQLKERATAERPAAG